MNSLYSSRNFTHYLIIAYLVTVLASLVLMLSHSIMANSFNPIDHTHQAPLSMEFSRQEYWSGLPLPPPWDLLNPGIEPTSPVSPTLQVNYLTAEPSYNGI